MNMNDFRWSTMCMELTGTRLNEFGANTVAETIVGEIKSTVFYDKLTARLATPDRFQRLDMLTGPKML